VLVTANILAALATLAAEQGVEARARRGGSMNQSRGCNTGNETTSDSTTSRSTEAGREDRIADKAVIEADADNRADDSADNDGLLKKKVMMVMMTLVTCVCRRGRRERNHNSRQQRQKNLAHFCTPSLRLPFQNERGSATEKKPPKQIRWLACSPRLAKRLILAKKAKAKAYFLLTIG
jgi:hypothetical protein